jgi:SOS response regulatory protein OraA/RecX
MLARRELSEHQIRARLVGRDFGLAEINEAVARLKQHHSLDDSRVASALAREELLIKGHGRIRAERQMKAAGLAPLLIHEALEATLAEIDIDQLVVAALSRRLRHGQTLEDDSTFRRLYRYLIDQGFDSNQALAALKAYRTHPPK